MEQVNGWKQIGNRLSTGRQNKNMTQEEFAGRLGVTPQALSKWERGASYPDISLLPDISRILEVSTDYLLGVVPQGSQSQDGAGRGEGETMLLEIGNFLRDSLEPLELVFGIKLVPAFVDNQFVGRVAELRKKLAREGILMPIVRLQDHSMLGEQEFMVCSYKNVLYSGHIDTVDGNTAEYMIEKLGACVREKYDEILSPDIMKSLVDNLKIRYPALIEGVIPEKIPYSLLTNVAKKVLRHGDGICYLPKMIELIDNAIWEDARMNRPASSVDELVSRIRREIEREDNFWVVTHKRAERAAKEDSPNVDSI